MYTNKPQLYTIDDLKHYCFRGFVIGLVSSVLLSLFGFLVFTHFA